MRSFKKCISDLISISNWKEFRWKCGAGRIMLLACAYTVVACAQPTIQWAADCQGCVQQWHDGFLWRSIALPAAKLWVRVDDFGDYWSAAIIMQNATALPVDILPASISLRSLTKQGAVIGAPQSPLSAAQFISRNSGGGVTQGIIDAVQSLTYPGARSTGTIQNSDGTYSRVDIYDRNTPSQAQVDAQRARQDRAKWAYEVTRSILQPNTVLPGQLISGDLYFKRNPKKDAAVILSIPFPTANVQFKYTLAELRQVIR